MASAANATFQISRVWTPGGQDIIGLEVIESGDLEIAVIPIPAAAWLFASALGLLAWVRRRAVL